LDAHDESFGPGLLPSRTRGGARSRVAVLFERFGPYHLVRLNCAAKRLGVIGVEFSEADRIYAWGRTKGGESFPRHVLSADIHAEPTGRLIRRMDTVLSAHRPEAVAIPGWSHRAALAALLWCQRSRVPAVLMSDSTAIDDIRRPWKEAVKRRVVSLSSAALAGGQPHRAYLLQLGMEPSRIFDGYDVVANGHFARGADAARARAADARSCLGLPRRYFLASCRFVEKKNLFRLINAFARYRGQAGSAACDLVLLGDGHLRSKLLELAAHCGLQAVVHMPGFKQYEQLPSFYGLAEAFVHASTTEQWGLVVNEAMAAGLPVLVSNRCGCAADLVVPGLNGYVFDPKDPDALADLMLYVASGSCNRKELARAGRALIANWTPQRFADNLNKAVQVALSEPRVGGAIDLLLLRALIARRQKAE
jgi:1,2-diacylglycerol 3-alpha-glucosyltransferase